MRRRQILWLCALAGGIITARGTVASERILRVGFGLPLATPSMAAQIAKDGDIIEIAAGVYQGNAAVWTQNRLTIRGAGGRARLIANGADAEEKAIWVIKGRPRNGREY